MREFGKRRFQLPVRRATLLQEEKACASRAAYLAHTEEQFVRADKPLSGVFFRRKISIKNLVPEGAYFADMRTRSAKGCATKGRSERSRDSASAAISTASR